MESFPFFFKIRAITFVCIMLFSFLWLVLLCVEMFARWSMSDQISQSLMILFTLTNTTTLIVLPMLILVQFRIWLDTARLLLLFVLQLGSAVAGSFWDPRIHCPDQTPDDMGVCQLIGVYTTIACWIIPAILVFYSTYFAVMVYLQSRIPVVVEPKLHKRCSGVDLEMGSTDSHCSWNEKMKEIIQAQGSNTDTSVPSRPLPLPPVHARQSSLPQSSALQRQPTSLCLPLTGQRPLPVLPSLPSRHHSLPAFQRGNAPHLHPLLTLSIPRPLATNVSPSHSHTLSSHICSPHSPANLQNQFPNVGPSIADVQSPEDRRGISRHFSMIPFSSSPREMLSAERSPTTRPTRARLSKPIPAHLM